MEGPKDVETEPLRGIVANIPLRWADIIKAWSHTTVIVYTVGQKIYFECDGRGSHDVDFLDVGDPIYKEYMPISSGGIQKLEVIEGRFVATLSGFLHAGKLLEQQVIKLAQTQDSVQAILDRVKVTRYNSQARLCLAGFIGFIGGMIGEMGFVGAEGDGMKDNFFAMGSGSKYAIEMFSKIKDRLRLMDDDEEIFAELRLCLAFACTKDRGSGGFCTEALINGLTAHLRLFRRHLIRLLSDHFLELEMAPDYEVFRFWQDSKNREGVDAVWIGVHLLTGLFGFSKLMMHLRHSL